MNRKFVTLFVLIALPLFLGFWTGYRVGHISDTTQRTAQTSDDVFQEASFAPSSQRDSINEEVGSQRRNAITRAVAAASPAVVGHTGGCLSLCSSQLVRAFRSATRTASRS